MARTITVKNVLNAYFNISCTRASLLREKQRFSDLLTDGSTDKQTALLFKTFISPTAYKSLP